MASDPGPAISVLQLRNALRGLSPPVWRRLLIPEHVTLARLHEVIQAAMGWTDDHLHQFIIRGRRYGESREGALQFSTAATALTMNAFALREHEAFFYVYDFNAWWRHDIRVEQRMLRQDIVLLPRCVAGCGACLPEWDPAGTDGGGSRGITDGHGLRAKALSHATTGSSKAQSRGCGGIGTPALIERHPPIKAVATTTGRASAAICFRGRRPRLPSDPHHQTGEGTARARRPERLFSVHLFSPVGSASCLPRLR